MQGRTSSQNRRLSVYRKGNWHLAYRALARQPRWLRDTKCELEALWLPAADNVSAVRVHPLQNNSAYDMRPRWRRQLRQCTLRKRNSEETQYQIQLHMIRVPFDYVLYIYIVLRYIYDSAPFVNRKADEAIGLRNGSRF